MNGEASAHKYPANEKNRCKYTTGYFIFALCVV